MDLTVNIYNTAPHQPRKAYTFPSQNSVGPMKKESRARAQASSLSPLVIQPNSQVLRIKFVDPTRCPAI
eukprot:m.16964 g.16964  ORF g.16964 m.16964 type:complete len:69 (-) comp5857_c0_seq1:179-385(-)